jgi:hypothetical protein
MARQPVRTGDVEIRDSRGRGERRSDRALAGTSSAAVLLVGAVMRAPASTS